MYRRLYAAPAGRMRRPAAASFRDNTAMKKSTLLGNITPAEFLRDYWHKKPLLIRQALPGFQAFLPRDELFALAAQEDVESRLITRTDGDWKLQSGPQTALSPATQPDWTLLV